MLAVTSSIIHLNKFVTNALAAFFSKSAIDNLESAIHSAMSAIHSALHSNSQNPNHTSFMRRQQNTAVQCTVQSDYTADNLAAILKVKRRQVFNYAAKICEIWHWEPEVTFKPSHGKFSSKMLGEMRKLRAYGTDEYRLLVGRENSRPVSGAGSELITVTVDNTTSQQHHIALDTQISMLQQGSIKQAENLASLLLTKLQEIQQQNKQHNQRAQILQNSELLAAQNNGYLQGIQIFQTQEAAKDSALDQLRAMKLKSMGTSHD